MKILFVTNLYPKEYYGILANHSHNKLQRASDVFQWAIIDGLHKCKADFNIVSLPSLPAYPINYDRLQTPNGEIIYEGGEKGVMLSYCNLVVFKTSSICYRLKGYINKWIESNISSLSQEDIIILTYTPYVPYIKAIRYIKKKYPRIKSAAIVTDLVDNMLDFSSNRKFLKRIQCAIEAKQTKKLYHYIDKFILLTKAMEEKIPEAVGRDIVIEGIFSLSNSNSVSITKSSKRILLYTGTFEEFSGIRDLIDAFKHTKNPDIQLHLCGQGTLLKYVISQCESDSRIKYIGSVSHERAMLLQKQATILINPRKPNNGITRFSFPSKTMEYLASGTPMIGYKLEGIPNEYLEYLYIPNDLSIDSLSDLITETLILPQKILDEKAERAKMFILNNKTSQKQVEKIMDFLEN